MKRIFSRKRKDYRLFAAALAFGFTATLATLLVNSPVQTGQQPARTIQSASLRTAETSTVNFAYASPAANQGDLFQPVATVADAAPAAAMPAKRYISAAPAPAKPRPNSMTEIVSIGKGDTLNQVFETFDIPRELALEAVSSLKGIFSPTQFRVGQQLTLLFKPSEDGGRQFRGYRFAADPLRDVIVLDDAGKGEFDATVVEKELKNVTAAKQGIITGSLIGATNRAGVPQSVVAEMIRVYSYSVDFQRDIHEGDRFEVMYRAKADDKGRLYGAGDLVYAKLILDGKDMPLYRFEDGTGRVDFLKADGSSNRRGLIRTPIDGARVSSGFGFRRHPILGFNKMHKGIDFAAPTGTPIYAAGDATVKQAGWVNGYGRFIKLQHNGGLATGYGHMSRFAKGIHVGMRVKQGDVIGYVGMTGRATGPHLHYEVIMGGHQVNPVGVKVPAVAQIGGKELNKFKLQQAGLQKEFKQVLAASRNQVASR